MGWFTTDIKSMEDLFLHTLQDIYYAEHRIEKALPDMIAKASDAELKRGFRAHLKQTKGQIKRLDQAFKKLGMKPQGTKCPAIEGIIDEANDIASEVDDKMVLTLASWAKLLGHADIARLLNANLKEEKATDKKLNGIATRKINKKALARSRKRPTRAEQAENAFLAAAAGIPAI